MNPESPTVSHTASDGSAPEASAAPTAQESLNTNAAVETPPSGAKKAVHGGFTLAVSNQVATLPLEAIVSDADYRIRDASEVEDIAGLATDIARAGQLFPIDVLGGRHDGRYVVVCGFRRVAALNFLQRENVVARVHIGLSDGEALLMAVTAAIHGRGVHAPRLAEVRAQLEAQGRMTPAVADMVARLSGGDLNLGPEHLEEEVDADDLASDVTRRLGQINQELSLLADAFGELGHERKRELIRQLEYSAELVEFLRSLG